MGNLGVYSIPIIDVSVQEKKLSPTQPSFAFLAGEALPFPLGRPTRMVRMTLSIDNLFVYRFRNLIHACFKPLLVEDLALLPTYKYLRENEYSPISVSPPNSAIPSFFVSSLAITISLLR